LLKQFGGAHLLLKHQPSVRPARCQTPIAHGHEYLTSMRGVHITGDGAQTDSLDWYASRPNADR
jgi:hypothetical protein